MGKGFEYIFPQRRYANGQQAQEKMYYYGNANQSYNDIASHSPGKLTSQNKPRLGEDVETPALPHSADMTRKWCKAARASLEAPQHRIPTTHSTSVPGHLLNRIATDIQNIDEQECECSK